MQDKIKIIKMKSLAVVILLFCLGFISGQYYETKDRNTVYVLNEAKFLKLASIGIAIDDKGESQVLTPSDKVRLKGKTKNLSKHLNSYSKHPVIIEKKNKQGYELYSSVKRIDITKELIIKLIGKNKWSAIGTALSH